MIAFHEDGGKSEPVKKNDVATSQSPSIPFTPNQPKVYLLLCLLERVRDMVERMLEEVRAAPPLLLFVLALLLKGRVFVHTDTLVEALMSVKNLGIT
jgi:hypothetical protein